MPELEKENLQCNLTKEEYLLACLGEECAEVIQAISKASRFGINHNYPKRGMTNKENIEYEIHDLLAVLEMLQEIGILDCIKKEKVRNKKEKVRKYMRLTGVIK